MNLLTRFELVLPLKTQICSPVWIPLLPQSLQLVYECLGMIRCYSIWKVTVAPLATWLIALTTFLALWLYTSCLFFLRRAEPSPIHTLVSWSKALWRSGGFRKESLFKGWYICSKFGPSNGFSSFMSSFSEAACTLLNLSQSNALRYAYHSWAIYPQTL